MSIASIQLLFLLLGADENPHERFLEQKEWYGHVVYGVSWRKTRRDEGSESIWHVRRRAEIKFRIVASDIRARERRKELENAVSETKKKGFALPPGVEKSMKVAPPAMWLPDRKRKKEKEQVQTVRVRDSFLSRHRCPGGEACTHGVGDHCQVVRSHSKEFEGDESLETVAGALLWVDADLGTYGFQSKWDDVIVARLTEQLVNPDPEDEERPSLPQPVSYELRFSPIEVKSRPLPSEGLVLTGEGSVEVVFEGEEGFKGKLAWTLSPKPFQPVDLRFELEDYDDWRPKGSMSEDEPGNDIKIRAWIEAKDGKPLEEAAKIIRFRLEDVTREPGICINYPAKPKSPPDADLRFLQEWNPDSEVESDGLIVKKKGEKLTEALAILSSFDWGAFGVLSVDARLESGRVLTGELKEPKGVTEARIPKSADDSWIADAWKRRTGASGADDSDDDPQPVGDERYKGDGLTLYEEYRGWYEWGKRVENKFEGGGDPKTKELFVCDLSGWVEANDLDAFHALTGLRVIGDLMESEITRDRVVNFNHGGDSRHRVAQHAVLVRSSGVLGDPAGSPQYHDAGTPASRGLIFLRQGPTGPAAGGEPIVDRFARRLDLIHDLLHCCNVRHHAPAIAEERAGVRWTLGRDDEGRPCLMEGAVRIRVILEADGADVTSVYLDQLRSATSAGYLPVRVGSWQGSGSGHPFCVMAMTNANYFRSRDDPRVRYSIRPEERRASHWFVCSRTDKLEWNAVDHKPEAHFGPAPAGGGDCLHQIVVNDGAHPTPR